MMGDTKEETKFLPFVEDNLGKPMKQKSKNVLKIGVILWAVVIISWLSWLTIISTGSRSEKTSSETILEKIIEEKMVKLDKMVDEIKEFNSNGNTTDLRKSRSVASAEVISNIVEGGGQLVKGMNKMINVFLKPMQSAVDALEAKILEIQNMIDDLTKEEKEKIPKSLALLMVIKRDLLLTRESLVTLAADTMKRVKSLVRVVSKFGPRTKKIGIRVKDMLKKFSKILSRSTTALQSATTEYKGMSDKLIEVVANLKYFGTSVKKQADAKEASCEQWVKDTRAAVYGGCAGSVGLAILTFGILSPSIPLCYAIAAPILETKIAEYKAEIERLKLISSQGSKEALELSKKAKKDKDYITEEMILIKRWQTQVELVSDTFQPVFEEEETLLQRINLDGKPEIIEMLCDLSSVCKMYIEHKYHYDVISIGVAKTTIPAQHQLCKDFKCPVSTPNNKNPNTIAKLSLGNFEIFGSIGDSLSAGAQYVDDEVDVFEDYDSEYVSNDLDLDLEEKKLVSFVSGASPNLVHQSSLYNILLHFSKNLVGGSSGSNQPGEHGPSAGLNFATVGATIRDAGKQANMLVDGVNEIPGSEKRWKLITFQFGVQDLCSAPAIEEWLVYVASSLQTLKDKLRKTVVIMIVPFDVTSLLRTECSNVRSRDCDWIKPNDHCRSLVRNNAKAIEDILNGLAQQFRSLDFGVEVMPALKNFRVDTSVSDDCLHPDDHHNSKIGKNLWNNLVSPAAERKSYYGDDLEIICPQDPSGFLPLTQPVDKVNYIGPGQPSSKSVDIERLSITNDEKSNDYIQIRFKNQGDKECTTQELNNDSKLKGKRAHKFPYDFVKNCFFEPEDKVQFRLETRRARGKTAYDKLCLTSVKLILSRVTFIAKQRTCAEGNGEWITMKADPSICG